MYPHGGTQHYLQNVSSLNELQLISFTFFLICYFQIQALRIGRENGPEVNSPACPSRSDQGQGHPSTPEPSRAPSAKITQATPGDKLNTAEPSGETLAQNTAVTSSCGRTAQNTAVPSEETPVPPGEHLNRISTSQPTTLFQRWESTGQCQVKLRPATQGDTCTHCDLDPPPVMAPRSRTWQEKSPDQLPAVPDHVTQSRGNFKKPEEEKKLTLPSVKKCVNKSCEMDGKHTVNNKTRSQEAGVIPKVKKSRSFVSTKKRTPSRRKSLTADAIRAKNKEISDKMER